MMKTGIPIASLQPSSHSVLSFIIEEASKTATATERKGGGFGNGGSVESFQIDVTGDCYSFNLLCVFDC
jgi:hypothetical protein